MIGILCIIAAMIVLAVYLLIPIPLLSYQQGGVKTDYGVVTMVKIIRPNVIEVALTKTMKIDPRLQQGNNRMISATSTTFIHFRKRQIVPGVGDKLHVSFVNRLHLFTGRSFNWAIDCALLESLPPPGGKIELIT